MTLLEVFRADYKIIPKPFEYKVRQNLLTLNDQEEALTKPRWAYEFALHVPGADIRKCEEVACRDPQDAYMFARCIPGADIKKCEEAACKDTEWAYAFALNIREADKEKCMKASGRYFL